MSIGHKRPEASSSFAILPSPARLLRRIQKFSRRCLLQDFPVQLCNNTDTYSHANHYSELNHFGLSDLQVQRQHRIKLNHQAQAWEKPCVRPLRAHSTHAVLAWCGAKVLGITPPLCAARPCQGVFVPGPRIFFCQGLSKVCPDCANVHSRAGSYASQTFAWERKKPQCELVLGSCYKRSITIGWRPRCFRSLSSKGKSSYQLAYVRSRKTCASSFSCWTTQCQSAMLVTAT